MRAIVTVKTIIMHVYWDQMHFFYTTKLLIKSSEIRNPSRICVLILCTTKRIQAHNIIAPDLHCNATNSIKVLFRNTLTAAGHKNLTRIGTSWVQKLRTYSCMKILWDMHTKQSLLQIIWDYRVTNSNDF